MGGPIAMAACPQISAVWFPPQVQLYHHHYHHHLIYHHHRHNQQHQNVIIIIIITINAPIALFRKEPQPPP